MNNKKSLKAYAVLLAGGTGTRLWPVSRKAYPKQLVKLIDQYSLLQTTIKRLFPLIDPEDIRIVCGMEHRDETARNMQEIGVDPINKLLCEPCGRNTAPAILLAVLHILSTEPDAIICIFPADHMINDIPEFHAKIDDAIQLAEKGHIVTFGIQPDYPETGYGYIEGAKALSNNALAIKRFVEKPDNDLAQKYVDAGNYFWNSGMFTFKATVIASEFDQHQPEMIQKMRKLDLSDPKAMAKDYEKLSNISIDYAIMEHTKKGAVLPSAFGWSDIGTWKSLYDFLPKDNNGNVLEGDVIAKDTQNSLVFGHQRLVATNHLHDAVIIETPDAIFISDMDNSRDVKTLVSQLESENREEYQKHRTTHLSWGIQSLLESEEGHDIYKLIIYPDEEMQLDVANGQVNHLTIVRGNGFLQSEDRRWDLEKGFSKMMLEGQSATIINSGADALHIICVILYD